MFFLPWAANYYSCQRSLKNNFQTLLGNPSVKILSPTTLPHIDNRCIHILSKLKISANEFVRLLTWTITTNSILGLKRNSVNTRVININLTFITLVRFMMFFKFLWAQMFEMHSWNKFQECGSSVKSLQWMLKACEGMWLIYNLLSYSIDLPACWIGLLASKSVQSHTYCIILRHVGQPAGKAQ